MANIACINQTTECGFLEKLHFKVSLHKFIYLLWWIVISPGFSVRVNTKSFRVLWSILWFPRQASNFLSCQSGLWNYIKIRICFRQIFVHKIEFSMWFHYKAFLCFLRVNLRWKFKWKEDEKNIKILFYLLALLWIKILSFETWGWRNSAVDFFEHFKESDYPAASLHRCCFRHTRDGRFFRFRTQTSGSELSKDFCLLIKYLMRFQRIVKAG